MKHLFRPLVPALAAALLLGACSDPTDLDVLRGGVRAIHLVGGVGEATIQLGAARIPPQGNLPYGFASPIARVPASQRTATLRRAAPAEDITSAQVTLESNVFYTLLAIGRAGATTGPTPRILVLPDTVTTVATERALRVVHGMPSEGNVDVYITAPNDDLAAANPVRANVPFANVTSPIRLTLATMRIRVTAAGTKTVIADRNNLDVPAGLKVTVVVAGDDEAASPTPFQVFAFPDP